MTPGAGQVGAALLRMWRVLYAAFENYQSRLLRGKGVEC